jgi:hypothetical protein
MYKRFGFNVAPSASLANGHLQKLKQLLLPPPRKITALFCQQNDFFCLVNGEWVLY